MMSNLFENMMNWLDKESIKYTLFDKYLIHYNTLGYEVLRIVDLEKCLYILCLGGTYVCKESHNNEIEEIIKLAIEDGEREDWEKIHGVDEE